MKKLKAVKAWLVRSPSGTLVVSVDWSVTRETVESVIEQFGKGGVVACHLVPIEPKRKGFV